VRSYGMARVVSGGGYTMPALQAVAILLPRELTSTPVPRRPRSCQLSLRPAPLSPRNGGFCATTNRSWAGRSSRAASSGSAIPAAGRYRVGVGRILLRGVACVAALAFSSSLGAATSAYGSVVWQKPEVLARSSFSSGSRPQVAVDSTGDAFAVWSRRPESNAVIEAATRPAGTGWQPAVRLSPAGESSEWPQLATTPQGEVIAVWESSSGSEKRIEVATDRPSAGWSNPLTLSTHDGRFGGAHDVAVSPLGEATVVWFREETPGEGVIEAATKSAGAEAWQAPVVLSAGDGAPQVAVDAEGEAVAVWQGDTTCGTIESTVKPALGTWQTPVALSTTGVCAFGPRVAIDPRGDVAAMWEDRIGGEHTVVQADSRPAGTGGWQQTVPLSSMTGAAAEARIAISEAGEAIVVWEQQDSGGMQAIEAAAGQASSGLWQRPTVLSLGGTPAIGEFPAIAMDPAGEAAVAWDQSNGTSYIVEAEVRAGPCASWQSSMPLSSSRQNSYLPSVALFPQGGGLAVWEVQAATVSAEAAGFEELDTPGQAACAAPMKPPPQAPVKPPPAEPVPPGIAPTITDLTQSSSSWREGGKLASFARRRSPPRGTTFSFTLNEQARITFQFMRLITGRWHKAKCTKQTNANRKGPPCVLTLNQGALHLSANRGRRHLSFQGRISRSVRLPPGRYRLVVTARNAAGQTAAAKKIDFTILK
jgi:hypothetical protein